MNCGRSGFFLVYLLRIYMVLFSRRDFMAIIRNAIQCKKCGDIIESVSVRDFKTCSCGTCSVDGGHEYLRRCAKSLDDFIDLSEFQKDHGKEK